MREIKFRGWHKEQEKMYSAEELGADQMTLMPDGRGFANISGDHTYSSQIDNSHKMIPLQYTGLKDKIAAEIYEGDIVIPYYTVAGYGQKREVRWGIGAWEPFDSNCDSGHTDRYEVIGNIYENPELLTT